MIKFLFLIAEAIFFLTVGLLCYYAPESSYFWNDGFGSTIYNNYDDMAEALILTPVLIFFNILISWLGLIKKINEWIVIVIYWELIGIIAMIPSAFTLVENAPFFLSMALVSAILSFTLSLSLERIISQKTRVLFLALFTFLSVALGLFIVISLLVGSGAS